MTEPQNRGKSSLSEKRDPVSRPPDSALRQAMIAGALVMQMGVSIVVSFYLGSWLDSKLGTTPWLSWSCLGLGGAGSVALLFRLARQVENKQM